MTEVGHILMGATVGVLCRPKALTTKQTVVHMAAFMILATIPDLPFKNWGHDRYYFSHSVFVTLLLIFLFLLPFLFSRKLKMQIGGALVLAGGACSWLSHLLLDSFYNHGKGIAIYWPISSARLALPIPWFDVATGSSLHIIQVMLIEFASYSPILLLAIWYKFKMSEHR
ncbi:MAG: metal-dependent hydrolase [Chloroflexi bacterium]|nr:metal-dependent hydrolase [Chloroflexota bacterium]